VKEKAMSGQLMIRIDEETKERFQRLSRMEGKSASEKLRELVENYIRKADISLVVDDLWGRVGGRLRERGVSEADVERSIRESRGSR
jgi:predicted DNA-binding protein